MLKFVHWHSISEIPTYNNALQQWHDQADKLQYSWLSQLIGWLVFNVPLNTLGSFRGWFLQARWPNQQCQSTEGNQLVVEIRLKSHQNDSTMLQ